jgi:hypothetical protein
MYLLQSAVVDLDRPAEMASIVILMHAYGLVLLAQSPSYASLQEVKIDVLFLFLVVSSRAAHGCLAVDVKTVFVVLVLAGP